MHLSFKQAQSTGNASLNGKRLSPIGKYLVSAMNGKLIVRSISVYKLNTSNINYKHLAQ